MPKIVINEKDETKPGVLAEDFDVVYVPGLVDTTLEGLTDDVGNYIGIEAHKPHLFTSLSDFYALCGEEPVVFTTDQMYSDLNMMMGADNIVEGFPPKACPVDRTLFKAGSPDPGYIMAKELLNQGISVLFERINPDVALVKTVQPSDTTWNAADAYSNYYVKVKKWQTLSTSTAPEWDNNKYFCLYPDTSLGADPSKSKTVFIDGAPEVVYECGESEPRTWKLDYTKFVYETRSNEWEAITADQAYESGTSAVLAGITGGKWENWTLAVQNTTTLTPTFALYTKLDLDGTGQKIYGVSKSTSGRGLVITKQDTLDISTLIAVKLTKGAQSKVFEITNSDFSIKLRGSQTLDLDNLPPVGTELKDISVIKTADSTPQYITMDTPSVLTRKTIDQLCSDLDVTFEDTYDEDGVLVAESTIRKRVIGASVDMVYNELSVAIDPTNDEGLADRGNYSFKYLTSGGYPVWEYNNNSLVTSMISLAEKRGDCVALIDHTDNIDRPMNTNDSNSLYASVKSQSSLDANGYGAMFTPWITYSINPVKVGLDAKGNDKLLGSLRLPASYAYLVSLAKSIKTNDPWLAIAGSARGKVNNIAPDGITTPISNGVADKMQPRENGVAINAITNIRPYGDVIWGNRTLKHNGENLVATSFLNIRNMVSDIKKVAYRTARRLTFEQNSDVLWVNFKGSIAPTLDRMVSGYGLSGYKIIRDTSHPKNGEKATLCAKIILYPMYAVEDFYITVSLQDDEVTVE